MLDATLDIISENSLLPTAFSGLIEHGVEQFINVSSVNQFYSSLLTDEISLLAQTIKASPLKLDTPILFTIFADWVAHLRTNQALADDFDEMDDSELLLTTTITKSRYSNKLEDSLLSKQVRYAIAGVSIDDNLLSYSD
jgi:hypothetical protein